MVQDTFLLDDIRFISDTTITYTSVQEIASKIPESFKLFQNYPNPFNSSTTIRFKLARSGKVTLKVYNVLGQEIQTLMDSKIEAGEHRVNWQPQNLGSGVYFYRLQTSGLVETRKLILVR